MSFDDEPTFEEEVPPEEASNRTFLLAAVSSAVWCCSVSVLWPLTSSFHERRERRRR
jgi:hypothetical protein